VRATFLLTVGLATASLAQDPVKTLPQNYRLVFENPFVRVIHVEYLPHQKLPVHDHPDTPTIYVYLTDSGPVRFSHLEQHAFTTTRQPLKAGAFRLSTGRLEKHEVENLGDIPTDFLRVQLKQVPLGFQPHDCRDFKPVDPARTGTFLEFQSPYVKVERAVAAAGETVETEKSADPSLLVAITATKNLKAGDVVWIDPQEQKRVSGVGSNPSSALRILFPMLPPRVARVDSAQ
jgi:quercetin dioxygenase-like cupin family protein